MKRAGTSAVALGAEVAEALHGRVRKPVVALESTIISHGMPFPQNLEMARRVEQLVRDSGACPATVCIADGQLKAGLSSDDLLRLAEMGSEARKCSTRDMAAAVVDRAVGATTVSSTMRIAHAAGIKVFVTGGIGGVHRFSEETMDISTDLLELSRTPVAVICAGVKSILDIPRTLEFLETHSVPVIGYGTPQFPAFFTQDSGIKAQLRRDSPEEVAKLIHQSLGLELPNGFVVAVPNPNPVPADVIDGAIELGLKEVAEKGISGQAVTPYLLKRLNEITGGASLSSNIDLVQNNAVVGSQIASSLLELELQESAPTATYSFPHDKPPERRNKRVLVVGGLVLDIISTSTAPIIRETSNIGTIQQTSGGVGRNIAECLFRLDADPLLVSAVGNDASGSILMSNLKTLGMNTSGIQISDELATAVYSAVLDSTGDLDSAIADMRAFEAIDGEAVSEDAIKDSKLVVADGNLSPETIGKLFKRSADAGVDVWFEPTSVQKAIRVVEAGAMSSLTYLSPNGDELKAISEAIKATQAPSDHQHHHERFLLASESQILPRERMTQLKNDMINVLLAMANGDITKAKHVIVTIGKHGVLLGSVNMEREQLEQLAKASSFPVEIWGTHRVHGSHAMSIVHIPGVEVVAKNCTGAGDSLVGGTVYGLLNGHDILRSCHLGMVAARQSLASDRAINPDLTSSVLHQLE